MHQHIMRLLKKSGLEERARILLYRLLGRHRIKRVTVCGETLMFACPSPQTSDYVATINFEKENLEDFLGLLRPGWVVWDVGANIGVWTLFCARKVGPTGHLTAFEPMREALALLRRNLELNRVENVGIEACALGDKDGAAEFFPAQEEALTTGSFLRQDGCYGTQKESVAVPLRQARTMAHKCGARLPDAIKIDVEGAEQLVLDGFDESLWRACRVLFLEVHLGILPSLGGSAEDIRRQVVEHDLRIVHERQRLDTLHWLCTKP